MREFSMKSKNEGLINQKPPSRLDVLKWLLVIVIIIGGMVANIYYSQVAGSIRAAVAIVLLAIALGLAFLTAPGRKALVFLKAARVELRKIVWPTRQEAIRTAMVVIGMVLVMSIILWGIDSVFLWIISLLTGSASS